jgi:cytosine deaminase
MTSIPQTGEPYWLTNAHVPLVLVSDLDNGNLGQPTREGLVLVDLEVQAGRIARICPAASYADLSTTIDLQRGIVFPCFVDLHTHLDKGHIWERSPNHSCTFMEALERVNQDRQQHWQPEDLYRRMEFGLKCSYAHGTAAIRTHIDCLGEQARPSFEVFKTLQQEWRDRLKLQGVALIPVEDFLTPSGEQVADLMVEMGGILGGVTYNNPDLEKQIDRIFALASERHLALDLHTDESLHPEDIALQHIAKAALRYQFSQPIVCGHCCSLSVQSQATIAQTINLVKQAGIGVVSLPLCNLFLQDRRRSPESGVRGQVPDTPQTRQTLNFKAQTALTPRFRGVTLLHELKQAGVPVAVASDNCRDPFFGFGDHDGLEVLTQSVRIAHLDAPFGDWCRTVTMTPADLMELPNTGRLGAGLSADLVLFKARYFSELFSRPQSDRIVLRQGIPINTTLPDYAELDDLVSGE